MQKYEIAKRLEELKNCEKIRLTTIENTIYEFDYENIINNEATEFLIINIKDYQFPYCAIKEINPAS